MYQEKQYTVEEYAEKLFTSTSSILRCVKQINLFLKDYNLTIQKKPMKIVGSEKQIRYFYSLFFWEKSGTKVGIAKYLDVSKAVEIVQELAVRTNVDLSPIMENELSIYLLIVPERISKGRTLDHYNAPIEVTKEVVNIIEELLKDKSIIVAKQEIEFMGFYYMNRYLKPNLTNHYATIEIVETFKQIDQFLTSFSEKHSFILTNKAVLQRRIFHYIMYKKEFQGRNFFFIDRAKKTLHQIDKIYHSFINLARSELEDWSFGDWIPKTNEETLGFLYILIINWEGLTSQVIQLQTKINVLIISHFGKNHELFLADILKNYFPNELKCYSLAENKFQNSEIDVVVTDSQIKEIRKNIIETIPIIGIDYAPNERNWKTIRTILTEIKQTNEKCNYQINAYSPFP
ncbi:helix-turn-helix domain-containing protein [Carnobacterium sp.]|uniref:helix-turn-helix domain-containing protein n=1 Tax=Carnobacterium sp. TaxID=48221 RepID=UPI0038908476